MAWGISRKLQAHAFVRGCLCLYTFSLQYSRAEQYSYFCLTPLEATELPAGCQGSVMSTTLTSENRVSGTIYLSCYPEVELGCPHFPFSHASTISVFTTSDKKTEGTWGMGMILFQFSHTHTFPFLMWIPAWCQPFTWVPFLLAGHPEDCFYLRVVRKEGNQSKLRAFSASFMDCRQLLF